MGTILLKSAATAQSEALDGRQPAGAPVESPLSTIAARTSKDRARLLKSKFLWKLLTVELTNAHSRKCNLSL
jgi:hypothetical protein